MAGWAALLVSLPFIATMLAIGFWSERHFAAFKRLPGHFDLSGRASYLAPRRKMTIGLSAFFALLLLVVVIVAVIIPEELRNGDPVVAAALGGAALVTAQGFVLWLTEKWASRRC